MAKHFIELSDQEYELYKEFLEKGIDAKARIFTINHMGADHKYGRILNESETITALLDELEFENRKYSQLYKLKVDLENKTECVNKNKKPFWKI